MVDVRAYQVCALTFSQNLNEYKPHKFIQRFNLILNRFQYPRWSTLGVTCMTGNRQEQRTGISQVAVIS
jgi:hypothetical protein